MPSLLFSILCSYSSEPAESERVTEQLFFSFEPGSLYRRVCASPGSQSMSAVLILVGTQLHSELHPEFHSEFKFVSNILPWSEPSSLPSDDSSSEPSSLPSSSYHFFQNPCAVPSSELSQLPSESLYSFLHSFETS